jgi:ribosomal protein L11 methylase PrmA
LVTRLRRALSDRTKGLIYFYEYDPNVPAESTPDQVMQEWIRARALPETTLPDGNRRVQLHEVYKSYQAAERAQPQDDWSRSWRNGVLRTRLTRRIVIVPRQSGRIELDSVRFA